MFNGKEWRKKHYLKHKERYRQYYQDNKATIREKHGDKQKVYRLARREHYKQLWRAYYKKHRNKLLRRSNENRKNNIEQVRIRMRKWYKANPDKVKAMRKGDYSRRKNAGLLTVALVQKVYEDNIKRYGTLTCVLCNKSIEFGQDSLEHLLPVSRGGKSEYDNLAIAHRVCNCSKRHKTLDEWNKYLAPTMEGKVY